jgi:YD repeat-containing protein
MNNLTGETDRDGRRYQYTYDADNNETAEKWISVGGGTATNIITDTYDAAERLTQVQDAHSKDACICNQDDRSIRLPP